VEPTSAKIEHGIDFRLFVLKEVEARSDLPASIL